LLFVLLPFWGAGAKPLLDRKNVMPAKADIQNYEGIMVKLISLVSQMFTD